jgi:hypothetical protein
MDSANDYLRENSHSKEKVLRSSEKVSSSKKNKDRLGWVRVLTHLTMRR